MLLIKERQAKEEEVEPKSILENKNRILERCFVGGHTDY
jgi:hypothetical protein